MTGTFFNQKVEEEKNVLSITPSTLFRHSK
jgi:hypothetical protein